MDMNATLTTLWWLTIVKIFIGAGLGFVLIGSLYKFKAAIMTVFGVLLVSNLLVLYLVLVLLSNG